MKSFEAPPAILVAELTADVTMKHADPRVTPVEAAEHLARLGNSILGVNDITGDIHVAHEDPAPYEIRWACDYCGAFSKDRDKVVYHESICERKPDESL